MFALIRRALKGDPNPPMPNFTDDYQWVENYLFVHQLPKPSYRYAYIFWGLVGLVAIVGGLAYALGQKSTLGSIWTQWSIRRPSWQRKYERLATTSSLKNFSFSEQSSRKSSAKQYSTRLTNGQILYLVILMITTAALCTLGPDYISSGATNDSPMQTLSVELPIFVKRSNDTITAQSPNYNISKAWWTAGGRTGLIAFTLIPLCVLIALKAPPFALFALPFSLQLHSDKLAWVHRWLGRLIYICTVAHVATWSVQLARDHRGGTKSGPAWKYMFIYPRFIFAIAAFVCMTLLIALSFPQIRNKHYEYFYFLHILLVPSTLVFSSLHYPPLGWFCWSSLVLWAAERLWRFVRVLWINDLSFAPSKHSPYSEIVDMRALGDAATPASSVLPWKTFEDRPSYEMDAHVHSPRSPTNAYGGYGRSNDSPDTRSAIQSPPPGYARAELLPGRTIRLTVSTVRRMTWAPGQYALLNIPCLSRFTSHPFTIASVGEDVKDSSSRDDNEFNAVGRRPELVFFIRAKQGFTLDLWNEVQRRTVRPGPNPIPVNSNLDTPSYPPSYHAPIFRAQVDGPYGSAARARWLTHSTVLIITGGTGVSFGLPILEYLCQCLSDRSKKYINGRGPFSIHYEVRTTRIRFVWLIREYSHLTWCATALRRCFAMLPPGAVQIDIFVTNFAPNLPSWQIPSTLYLQHPPEVHDSNPLVPPAPHFATHARDTSRSSSPDSIDSESDNSIVDLGYAAAARRKANPRGRKPRPHSTHDDQHMDEADITAQGQDGVPPVQHTVYSDSEDEETHDISELTNFEGEEDARAPGEIHFSMTLKRKGRHIRMRSYHQSRSKPRRSPVRPPTPNTKEEDKTFGGSITADVVFGSSVGPSTSHTPAPPSQSVNRSMQVPPSPSPPPPSASSYDRLNLQRPFVPPIITKQPSQSPVRTPPPPSPTLSPASPHRQSHWQTRHQHTPSGLSIADTLASDHSGTVDRGPSPSMNRTFDPRSAIDDRTHLRVVSPIVGVGESLENLYDVNSTELDDLSYVASLARSGRPRLDRILAEEVNRASGALAVACCGPTSLSNVVRKVVSSQINPSHVYNGDERGAITFISEDFSF